MTDRTRAVAGIAGARPGSGAIEVELKLQVPPRARAAVHRAVATRSAVVTPLRASYADTLDDRLAGAGLALRLRKEGRRWRQCLKGRGDGVMQRLEHEVALPAPPSGGLPDPALHAGTPAGRLLHEALGGAPLQALYRTEIRRTHRLLRSGGALIEIAFDEGRLVAGGRSLPVCEVEFELKSGPAPALLALAETWAQRHGLWLDARSKSERGHALARGQRGSPAARAEATPFGGEMTAGQVFAQAVESALRQLLANGSALAAGDGGAEHLHQWRVAVRRLRTALRLFAPWSGAADECRAIEREWRAPFLALGARRDDDVLRALLDAPLAAAGLPPLVLGTGLAGDGSSDDAAITLRDPALTVLALRTLRLALQATEDAPASAIGTQGSRLLRREFRRAMKSFDRFSQMPVAAQHRLRKRLKRLRYAAEFLRPARGGKAMGRSLSRLCAAVEALGRWNDATVAASRLAAWPQPDASVTFARGWLAARHGKVLRDAERALRRLKGGAF